jgi:hypothetical protein
MVPLRPLHFMHELVIQVTDIVCLGELISNREQPDLFNTLL